MARANRQFRSSLDLDLQGNVLLGADHNWSDEVAYQTGDLVVYNDNAWIAVTPVDGTEPADPAWTQLSSSGMVSANDGEITIQVNGSDVGVFNVNQDTDQTIDLTVPAQITYGTGATGFNDRDLIRVRAGSLGDQNGGTNTLIFTDDVDSITNAQIWQFPEYENDANTPTKLNYVSYNIGSNELELSDHKFDATDVRNIPLGVRVLDNLPTTAAGNPTGALVRLSQPEGDNPEGLYIAEARIGISPNARNGTAVDLTSYRSSRIVGIDIENWTAAAGNTVLSTGNSWNSVSNIFLSAPDGTDQAVPAYDAGDPTTGHAFQHEIAVGEYIYIYRDADNHAVFEVTDIQIVNGFFSRYSVIPIQVCGVITNLSEFYWVDGTERADNTDILSDDLTWHHSSANTYIDLGTVGDTATLEFIIPEGALLKQTDSNSIEHYFHRISNIPITVNAGDTIPDIVGDITGNYLEAGSPATDGNTINYNATTGELQVPNGGIDTDQLADGAVTNIKLQNYDPNNVQQTTGVTTAKIADGAVTEAKIGGLAVTTVKIANDAVQGSKIADGHVSTSKLQDYDPANVNPTGVTTAKLANGAVTNAKLGAGAVSTDKILNSNVTQAKIANDAINSDKIADDAVNNEHIRNNAVQTAQINDNAVTNAKLADNAVGTDEIADNAISGAKIQDVAVGGSKIAGFAVTTNKIADFNVTEDKIANEAVSIHKLGTDVVFPSSFEKFSDVNLHGSLTWTNHGTADSSNTDYLATPSDIDYFDHLNHLLVLEWMPDTNRPPNITVGEKIGFSDDSAATSPTIVGVVASVTSDIIELNVLEGFSSVTEDRADSVWTNLLIANSQYGQANGNVLTWNSTDEQWEPSSITTGTPDVDGVTIEVGSGGLQVRNTGIDTDQLRDSSVTSSKIANDAVLDQHIHDGNVRPWHIFEELEITNSLEELRDVNTNRDIAWTNTGDAGSGNSDYPAVPDDIFLYEHLSDLLILNWDLKADQPNISVGDKIGFGPSGATDPTIALRVAFIDVDPNDPRAAISCNVLFGTDSITTDPSDSIWASLLTTTQAYGQTNNEVLVWNELAEEWQPDFVRSGQIANGAVNTSQLANFAVDANKIENDAVQAVHIATNAVTTDGLNVSGDGTSGQVLTSNGSGGFTWENAGAGEANVQANWTETDTTSDAFIQNKPTIPTVPAGSHATNWSDYTLDTELTTGLATKQDTLSTAQLAVLNANAFTDADHTKLDGIAASAEVNVQSDWNITDNTSDAFILNKPTIPNTPSSPATAGDYNLQVDAMGVSSWVVDAGGSGTGEANVQADWNVIDSSSDAFILNKPALPSGTPQSNWSDYALAANIFTGDYADLSNRPTIPDVPDVPSATADYNLRIDTNGDANWVIDAGGSSTYSSLESLIDTNFHEGGTFSLGTAWADARTIHYFPSNNDFILFIFNSADFPTGINVNDIVGFDTTNSATTPTVTMRIASVSNSTHRITANVLTGTSSVSETVTATIWDNFYTADVSDLNNNDVLSWDSTLGAWVAKPVITTGLFPLNMFMAGVKSTGTFVDGSNVSYDEWTVTPEGYSTITAYYRPDNATWYSADESGGNLTNINRLMGFAGG